MPQRSQHTTGLAQEIYWRAEGRRTRKASSERESKRESSLAVMVVADDGMVAGAESLKVLVTLFCGREETP